jgi:hypothetical protein
MLTSKLVTAAAVVLVTAAPADAQTFEEPETQPVPGWILTPSVAVGATADDNPVMAGEGDPTPDDTITSVSPSLNLAFTGKHSKLSLGYDGSLVRYRTLDEYDSFDQGAVADFQHQASRRVSWSIRNRFSDSPTTDAVQIAGVPFIRRGMRQDQLVSGTTIRATERLELNGSYGFQWVEFDRPSSPAAPLLDGGKMHAFTMGAVLAIGPHVGVGTSYSYHHAIIGEVGEVFNIQNGEGTIAVQVSPTVTLEGGAGVSHVSLPENLGTRTGPAGRIALVKRTEHAMFGVSAMRSFVPAFGFGGSLRNREVAGSVRVPFRGTRGFVQGKLAWRESEPVLAEELGLTAVSFDTIVGYALQRWLRLEAFYIRAFQDTPVAGGRMNRNRFGVQIVTLRPMRIQ